MFAFARVGKVLSSDLILTTRFSSQVQYIEEQKVHCITGKVKTFSLEKWRMISDKSAVGRWVALENNIYNHPVNTTSWGVWSSASPHLTTYRLHDPEGNLLYYRFDVIDNLKITNQVVSFRDLLLDAVVKFSATKEISVNFEDEDEVEDAIQKSQLDPKQVNTIQKMKAFLKNTPYRATSRADDLIEHTLRTF